MKIIKMKGRYKIFYIKCYSTDITVNGGIVTFNDLEDAKKYTGSMPGYKIIADFTKGNAEEGKIISVNGIKIK